MTREEFERAKKSERLRAAKKRRHRKVVMHRILAVLFLAALIYSIIFCIILIDRHLKGPEPAEPDPDWQQRYANNDPTPAAPTDTPTPTPEPEYTPTPSPVPIGVKRVAFTFDDGPHSTYTRKFVDKLVSYGGKATWFVVGNRIDAETGADLKYAVDQGMEIGIHAWTHEFYFDRNPDKLDDELDKTAAKIKEVTGVEPTLFRPPGGNFTDKQVAAVRYPVILWSVDTEDWKNKSTDTEELRAQNIQKTVDRIMRETKDGSIVLMHEIYSNSYDAFCLAIDRLSKEGYVFVTVSELIGDELRPGHRYSSWYQR